MIGVVVKGDHEPVTDTNGPPAGGPTEHYKGPAMAPSHEVLFSTCFTYIEVATSALDLCTFFAYWKYCESTYVGTRYCGASILIV